MVRLLKTDNLRHYNSFLYIKEVVLNQIQYSIVKKNHKNKKENYKKHKIYNNYRFKSKIRQENNI
jgi:hypothetical protein